MNNEIGRRVAAAAPATSTSATEPIERWKVKLKGEATYLEHLSDLFCAADLAVKLDSQDYYLVASSFEELADATEVRAKAIQLLRLINGLEKFNFGDSQPVEVEEIRGWDKDGRQFTQIAITSSINFMVPRVKIREGKLVVSWDGTDEAEQREVVQGLMKLALSNENIAKAFRILESHELNWNSLYKLYEIIQSDIGDEIFANGWASKADLKLFTHTANSYLAIGEHARHVHENFEAPAKPMTETNAEYLVMDILAKWICSKN